MRQLLMSWCIRIIKALQPKQNLAQENAFLKRTLDAVVGTNLEHLARAEAMERMSELIEARRMAGSGPWQANQEVLEQTDRLLVIAASRLDPGSAESLALHEALTLRETPITAQGAYGDIELALQNVEWRREVNMSWLEFSRWGIQQIILISRLYFIKNPLIQRGINVAAHYVFGRGVEVTTSDETANEVLKDFFERNKTTLGQIALTDLERRKYYDGNLFFVFFPDRVNSGQTSIRTIDATEIMDIVTDPNDTDTPWFYHRTWTERTFDIASGVTKTGTRKAWYPALNYEPADRLPTIAGDDVYWDNPVHHRKCGAVAKWNFGCPLVYAALDWAKASRKFLEHVATVKQSLAQISIVMSTKGGQQALQGLKGQLQTTVQTGSNLWDTNPTAVNASVLASGPGTKVEAFNTRGAGGDPEEVRQFKLMVCMVFGLPETFFADVQTGNLATAQSLDRPTELNFLEKQEAWREDLIIIAKYVLRVNSGAPSGKLRESITDKTVPMRFVEAPRVWKGGDNGWWVMEKSAKPAKDTVEISVNFPAIVEGDVPQLIAATVAAAGTNLCDEKALTLQMYDLLPGIDGGVELADAQYPGTPEERQKEKDKAAEAAASALMNPKTTTKEAVALARRLVEAVQRENGAA